MKLGPHPRLDRTSPKGPGMSFIGRCPACGQEGLTFADMDKPCPNPGGMTQEQALLGAIDPPAEEKTP